MADTRSEASLAALFARIGELDHLVYTAGDAASRDGRWATCHWSEARQLFEVRFWGLAHLSGSGKKQDGTVKGTERRPKEGGRA